MFKRNPYKTKGKAKKYKLATDNKAGKGNERIDGDLKNLRYVAGKGVDLRGKPSSSSRRFRGQKKGTGKRTGQRERGPSLVLWTKNK